MPRGLVAAAVAAIVVLALLSAPMSSAFGKFDALLSPAPTATLITSPTALPSVPTIASAVLVYPTPTLIASALGPIPMDCPQGSPLISFDTTMIIPGVGGSVVWIVAGAFQGPHAVAHLGPMGTSAYTMYGWPIAVQILIKYDFTQPVTLTANDLESGYPLWFANNDGTSATPSLTIESQSVNASTSDGQWVIWFGMLYVPGAGCYSVVSSWPGGGWTAHFAAGR